MKTCSKCGETKELTDFYENKRSRDGKRPSCKICHKKCVAGWQKRNPDKAAKSSRSWQKRNRDKANAISKEYRRRNREELARKTRQREAEDPRKPRARAAVAKAVKNGDLIRKPCHNCDNPKSEAHHPDYNDPLRVVWLCHPCHMKEHRKYAT